MPAEAVTAGEFLDGLEADLHAVEEALARGEAPSWRDWLPPPLAQPPDDRERRRAAALGERLDAVLKTLVEARAGIVRDLGDLDGHRRAARSYGLSSAAPAPHTDAQEG